MEIETKDRVTLSVRVPVDMDQWLSDQAKRMGVTKAALIMLALHDARKREQVAA